MTDAETISPPVPKRWSARRKSEVVIRIIRGEPLDEISREICVEIYRLEQWRDQAIQGINDSLKDRINDPIEAELDRAKKQIRRASHASRAAIEMVPGPFSMGEVEEMSATTSPSTRSKYGVDRVCRAWGFSPATYYRKINPRAHANRRPGPKPLHSDQAVIDQIRGDLKESPFVGEGHRKVHARLSRKGVVVGRQRILRLMAPRGPTFSSQTSLPSAKRARREDYNRSSRLHVGDRCDEDLYVQRWMGVAIHCH